MAKRTYKKHAKAAAKVAKKHPYIALFLAVLLVVVVIAGYFVWTRYNDEIISLYNRYFGDKKDADPVLDGELSIHFLEPGNEYNGDCIYIKAGETDILIDAGSKASSVSTISEYLNGKVTDGILEYVIATHADSDHIAGFAASDNIFSRYECKTIIDFALSNKTTATYENYKENRDAEVEAGANHYTALQCWQETDGAKKCYELSNSVTMKILYNYYYEHNSTDENNYSVCIMIEHGNRNFLFTGDLEKDGEEKLVQYNSLPIVDLFKAGHHGSKTSSNDVLLSVIKPKIVCVSCCAGSVEYTQNLENTFPTQNFIDRIAKYTDKVYVTTAIDLIKDGDKWKNIEDYSLLNGNIVVTSDTDGVSVKGSNNDTILKDTDWFKENRTCPTEWAS